MKYDIVCSTKNLSTEEWLKIRTLGIGGSDAGIIAGCNPYRSIFELWQEKRGEIPVREEESEVIHFGKVLEDVVRKEFIQRTGLMVRKKNSILRSKEYPFMIADLDGVVSEFDGTYSIFEAKTAIEFKNNDWKNGEIPKAYQLQVQHYLAVTGFQKAYIAVLVGGNKFYWTEIYRDEQLIKMLVSMESHFWHCVKTGEEPDVDASKATSLYVPFLDLAVVYYIDTQLDYKNAPEHRGTAVTKDIFKIWSVEPEVIWKQVLENMGKESLFLMLVVTEEENSLMTFEDAFQKNQGALALLQKSILDEAKKKLEEPFYILPVSIFELMIVPESQADEVEEMKKAIIESNHEMPVEYLLSNNVYYYGEKEEVEIAG